MFSKLLERYHNHQFPRLKQVNGLLNLGALAFGWFNLALGLALFTRNASTNEFFIIAGVFTYQFWGVVFFLGGLSLLIGHMFNFWRLMRVTTLFLIFTKIVWLTALTYRQIVDPESNIFLLLFFALATVLQIGGYIYFPVYKKVESWKR